MTRLTLIILLSISFHLVYSQQDVLNFKKRNKVIQKYWNGGTIAFQLKNGQWQKGEITVIRNDSFYIRPMVVQYSLMSIDTFHYRVKGFALTDVYAMPNRGILIDYINGHYQVSRSGGHVHFYWIKSGWIFRAGAAGYAGLNIANGLINKDLSLRNNKTQLLAAAAVFLGGMLLHKKYKPYLRIGRKYHLVNLKLFD